MKTKLTLLLALLAFCVSGAWAGTTITLVNGTNESSLSCGTFNKSSRPHTFTSNATSGLAGCVISTYDLDQATWWSQRCLSLLPSATKTDETVSITAPNGYVIVDVSMVLRANSSNYPYDVTFDGTKQTVTGAQDFSFSKAGINAKSFSFIINHTQANFDSGNKWLAVKSMTVTVKPLIIRAGSRVNSITAGTNYMIYNVHHSTAIGASNNNEPRCGFVGAYNGSITKDLNTKPTAHTDVNGYYLWQLENSGTDGQYYLKSLYAGQYYKAPKTLSATEPQKVSFSQYGGESQSLNEDGTGFVTDPSTDDKLFKIENIGQTDNNQYWNGNKGSFTTWKNPHPYAIYTVTFPDAAGTLGDIKTNKKYNIANPRGWWAVAADATVINSTDELSLAKDYTDTKQQFAFILHDSHYYLYSISESKFAYVDGTKLSLSEDVTDAVLASPVTCTPSEYSNKNTYSFIMTIGGLHFGVSTGQTPDIYQYTSTNDEGNGALLIEAGNFDATVANAKFASVPELVDVTYNLKYNDEVIKSKTITSKVGDNASSPWATPAYCTLTDVSGTTLTKETTVINITVTMSVPFTFSPTFADATWYYLKLHGKYAMYGDTAPYSLTSTKATAVATAEKALWAFIGNPFDGFRVVNKAAGEGKYLDSYNSTVEMGSTVDGYSLWTLGQNNYGFTLHSGTQYLNDISGNGVMGKWGNALAPEVDGSSMAIEDVDYYDLTLALLDEYYTEYGITDEQSFGIRPSEKSAFEDLMSTAYSANHSSLTSAVYDNTIRPAIISLLYPKSGKYYLIKNNYNNKYMHVTASGTRGTVLCDLTAEEAAKDVSAHFYITENDSKPYLTTQGEYLNWVWGQVDKYEAFTSTGFDKYVHWAIPTPGVGAFSIAYGNGEGSYAEYLGSGYYALKGTESTIVAGSSTNETSDLAQWTFEEVTTLTIDLNVVGSKSYATFCAPFDVTIGSGATAYQVDLDTERDRAVYSAITGNKVPAGAGVLLISDDAETSVTATIRTSGDAFSALVGNDLVGYKFVPAFSYPDETTNWNLVLGNSATSGIGFYKMNGTASPNKAYLPYPHEKSSLVKGLILVPDDEEETSIRSIDNEQLTNDNAAIYNLSGQRISKLQKGINIVNGKKMIVK